MPSESPIDRHIADLYRAAAGELPWDQPLQGMVDALRAWGIYLHGVRLANGAVAGTTASIRGPNWC